MIFPDKNQICRILLSIFIVWSCRTFLSIYSIPMWQDLIHIFLFLGMTKMTFKLLLFCGLRPHPASGIELEISGNNINADGIELGTACILGAAVPAFVFYK